MDEAAVASDPPQFHGALKRPGVRRTSWQAGSGGRRRTIAGECNVLPRLVRWAVSPRSSIDLLELRLVRVCVSLPVR